ncbi:MAG: hypothetical protein EPO52_17630 [Herbiconiux sp.]|uniref:hypothetical protein n=1 Tax=Herbiconiux sp. TaxID=1871186 RepID=UPI00121CECFF|nr:hypothetical protein [Herbiconiux sp.]TAJ46354.1 MAG: hypothetical protein EPO52_17630 [Herbiconiux sp.]
MSVTPNMIAVALGVTAPESNSVTEQQWKMWVNDALLLIDSRRVKLGLPADAIPTAKLDYVVREAVVAHVKKPDDATQVTISIDDGSSSRTYQSGKGRVTIIDEWWTLLGLTEPDGAFSLDMLGVSNVHLPWCALNFGATYCSCGVDIAGRPIFEGGDDE